MKGCSDDAVMIEQPHYRLTPTALEDFVRLPVNDIVATSIFAHMVPSDDETTVPVTLTVDPLTQAWRVRWEFGVLGEIPAEVREEFSSLNRVIASGFVPETKATISAGGPAGIEVAVLLPPPDLAVPRNDVSPEAWILPTGSAFTVDTSDGEIDALDLVLYSPGQWLVTLVELDGTVVATIDGRAAGTISEGLNDTLLRYLRAAQQRHPDAPIAVRGFIVDSDVVLDAGFPRADEYQLPALKVPDDRPRSARQLFLAEDGALVVSVDRVAALDPADEANPHSHARRVVSPHGMASEPDDASEEKPESPAAPDPQPEATLEPAENSLPIDGAYLTEVEKLRARRAQRKKSDGPRHASETTEVFARPLSDQGHGPRHYRG
ncbi:Uncharacterised protein [Corynebacterium pilosum]|uniref:Uncharacterized protein n=2 Tax=Corynebacterium pilosum TaxID=35756 RepID=A0A376CNQ5_9CORY|nr:Uncharacterised protein [Corynebacterium pilosum]